MTTKPKEIYVPLQKCSLKFTEASNLESEYQCRARQLSYNLLRTNLVHLTYVTIGAWLMYIIIYIRSGKEFYSDSASYEERRTYWIIIFLPVGLLLFYIELLLIKINICPIIRGSVLIIGYLTLVGERHMYVFEGDDNYGLYAVFIIIAIHWTAQNLSYNWISAAVSLQLGMAGWLFFSFYAYGFRINKVIGVSAISLLLTIFARTAERHRRREFFILNAVKKKEEELENMVSKLPIGIVIIETDESGTATQPERKVKYSNQAMKDILSEMEPQSPKSPTDPKSPEDPREREFGAINIVSGGGSMSDSQQFPDSERIEMSVREEEGQELKIIEDFVGKVYLERHGGEGWEEEEMAYKLKNGKYKNIKLNSINIEYQDKESIGIIVEDLTLSKQIERDKLSTEFQNRLVRTISHEIRTPLNSIQGGLEIVENMMDIETREKSSIYFRTMKNGVGFLLYFIDGMLNLSKAQHEMIPLTLKQFNISELLEDIITLFLVEIENKKETRLILDTEHLEFTEIIHDKNAIAQLIVVLVNNSVKYSYKGSITIKITDDPAQGELRISVKDEGIGISEEQQNHLFHLYGKALDSEFGTGIGLTLCKSLVESMRGNILLESKFGVGTEVTIKFPCRFIIHHEVTVPTLQSLITFPTEGIISDIIQYHLEASPSRLFNIRRIPQDMIGPEEEHKMTHIPLNTSLTDSNSPDCNCPQILIVDDIPSNILILRGLLRLIGLKADSAQNGQEAIEKIIDAKLERTCCGNYRLVFMDCNMPIMDGYTATREIVRLAQEQIINSSFIVAVTAYNSFHNTELCYASGMNHILFKPVSRNILIQFFRTFNLFQETIDRKLASLDQKF